jgi:hypothetical protein
MSETGLSGELPGVASELHGRPTRRLDNGKCWLEVLSAGGPRIVGFGLAGRPNILAELPDTKWDAGFGTFELVGGHRMWFAPESPACSASDSTGLVVAALGDGLRLTGPIQPPYNLRKTFEVTLAAGAAAAHIHHVIANEGDQTLELAPWAITVMRLGGTATVELPPYSTARQPTKLLVLWPYTSWHDERLGLDDRELTVLARSGDEFKMGCLSFMGRVTYDNDGVRFVKRFDPALAAAHPDMGTNCQIYVSREMIEVESLAPLTRLAPGESVGWDEDWELGAI